MRSILLFISLLCFTSSFCQSKIGIINKQLLLDSLPSRQMLLEEVSIQKLNNDKELGAMDSVLVSLMNEYQVNASGWTETIKQYQEARIMKVQNDLKQREEQIELQLKVIEAESIRKSELIIKEATVNVSAKLALDLVIDSTETIYFKEKLDITKQVQVEMRKLDKASTNLK